MTLRFQTGRPRRCTTMRLTIGPWRKIGRSLARRRESASKRGFYRSPDHVSALRPQKIARKAALLQQHQRYRCGLRMRGGVRSAPHRRLCDRKHANPCGVAEADNLLDAYRKALACDLTRFRRHSALNRKLDADAAKVITEIFTEVIIAPGNRRSKSRLSRPGKPSIAGSPAACPSVQAA